jgi:hypothetical protein
VRGKVIAANALDTTQKANNKLKKDEATKKANESIKKIFESVNLKENGEERTADEIREQLQTKREIAESKIVRYREVVGADGNGGTDEEKAELKKLDMEIRTLKKSETRVGTWVKNREDSTWKDSTGAGTPVTTVPTPTPTR